ncbi:MAG: effector-associated constant component EACC1 [Acidimicrobiales bacterium]
MDIDRAGDGGGALELVIEPATDRFDPDDERWHDQVGDLMLGLRKEVGGVRREVTPVDGTKGGVAQVILALGSAGAFTAAVEYFRAWLGRDRTRRLEVSWEVDGERQSVSVQGDAIDQSAIRALAEAAARRLGGAPFPAPATEPS